MKTFHPLLQRDAVHFYPSFATKEALLLEVAGLFATRSGLDQQLILHALQERETLDSTALGEGIALPHGRVKLLKEAYGLFIRLDQGIPTSHYSSPDGLPVDLILALIFPPQSAQHHLETLARVAQMFADQQICQALRHSSSPVECFTLLSPHLNAA